MNPPTFPEVLVVGMHFRGPEAKAAVANMVPPVELELEREPFNRFDENAIKVNYLGEHLGYIEASQACFLAPWLDRGVAYTCTVDSLVEKKRNLHPLTTCAPAA